MDLARLHKSIERGEGCRLTSYLDTRGVWTIGWGHTGHGIGPGLHWAQAQADQTLDADIEIALGGLDRALPWWRDLDDPRANVIAEMAFNLGVTKFLKFVTFLELVRASEFSDAAEDGRQTLWARQVKGRATRLMKQLETGEWQ